MSFQNNQHDEHKRVLVVGACALDRLLHVQKYPQADSKILCQGSYEFGGGNAANTASGLGRMSTAKVLQTIALGNQSTTIQLLTKVADDDVKKKICDELIGFSVDISSDLFLQGPKGSKSPVATVIVANDESHTRTCFFDKGSCGVLEKSDVDNINFDDLFKDVLILHSDSRHTEAAVLLAEEAKKRWIPVSLDVERDRFTSSFDSLIDIATMIFTSDLQLKKIIQRRIETFEKRFDIDPKFKADKIEKDGESNETDQGLFIDIVSVFYSLMRLRNNFDQSLELIITRGRHGAHCCKLKKYSSSTKVVLKEIEEFNIVMTNDVEESLGRITLQQSVQRMITKSPMTIQVEQVEYEIYNVGPPNVNDVIDTTGAGDAFAAGYLWSSMILSQTNAKGPGFDQCLFKLRMGSWCAGKKLAGPGARNNLPCSEEIDNELGFDVHTIFKSLESKVSKSSLL